VVEAIHEYLRSIGEEVRAGKIPIDDFIINKVRVPRLEFSTIWIN
jgi:hypothetical protein